MKTNCSSCEYGPLYDPLSDWCDECMCDPNTGWGGFYDHRIEKGFMNDEEQEEYYREHLNSYDENESKGIS